MHFILQGQAQAGVFLPQLQGQVRMIICPAVQNKGQILNFNAKNGKYINPIKINL
jgi:hypothetical protein